MKKQGLNTRPRRHRSSIRTQIMDAIDEMINGPSRVKIAIDWLRNIGATIVKVNSRPTTVTVFSVTICVYKRAQRLVAHMIDEVTHMRRFEVIIPHPATAAN